MVYDESIGFYSCGRLQEQVIDSLECLGSICVQQNLGYLVKQMSRVKSSHIQQLNKFI